VSKNIPQRMCVACRNMKDKSDLIRIVKTTEGNIEIDLTSKKNGRGAYICKDKSCFEKCKKSKALNRTFKTEVPNEVLDKLKEQI